jgi:hypothetical protein
MVVHRYPKLAVLRTVPAQWLVLCTVLLVGALVIAYFSCDDRSLPIASSLERMRLHTLILDDNLVRQFDGARSALDSVRDALRANSGCAADCRRLLLHVLKRALRGG